MTTLVFLHGPYFLPNVWRPVADFLPPNWGVAAPNLGLASTITQMCTLIDDDVAAIAPRGETVIVVAEGLAAIPAIRYAAARPERVAGVVLANPQISLSRAGSKVKAINFGSGPRNTRASSAMRKAMLGVFAEVDARSELAELTCPVHVLSVRASAGSEVIKVKPEVTQTVVSGAQADWFDYAPKEFSWHVAEFTRKVD